MSKNTILPYKWKEYVFHSGISWNFSIHSGEWTNSGKKREWQSSANSLFSSMNPFGIDPDEEKPNVDHTVSQKVHHQTHWKHTQDAVYWIKLSMTQDVKPSLLSAMWFSLHSFLVSCTWSTDCVCVWSRFATKTGCQVCTGSRIAILVNKIICNHHQRHSSRKLRLPSDFPERRSSTIRKARNTTASTQEYVKEQLTHAAAAACSQY